jgi:hypothetical protein
MQTPTSLPILSRLLLWPTWAIFQVNLDAFCDLGDFDVVAFKQVLVVVCVAAFSVFVFLSGHLSDSQWVWWHRSSRSNKK